MQGTARRFGQRRMRAPRQERGIALGLALTVLLIVSLITATIIPFAFSHMNLSYVDQRYSDALHLAEAGVNYEIQRMNASVFQGQYPPAHGTSASPDEVTFDQNRSSLSVYAEEIQYGVFRVHATGISHGVPRRVQVKVAGVPVASGGPVGTWSMFALNSLNSSAGMSVNAEHPIGSNGSTSFRGNSNLGDNLYLAGNNASTNYDEYTQLPTAFTYPTVANVANQMANAVDPAGGPYSDNGGMQWLQNNNDNQNIRGDTASGPTVPLSGDYVLNSDEFAAASTNTIVLYNPYTDGTTANFYLRGIDSTSPPGGGPKRTTYTLRLANDNGPVALWIDNASDPNAPAEIDFNVITNNVPQPLSFKIYFNGATDASTLNIGLNSDTVGAIYAIRGTVNIQGPGNFKGTLIADNINLNGPRINITFPWTQSQFGFPLPTPGSPDPDIGVGTAIGYFASWQWDEINPR